MFRISTVTFAMAIGAACQAPFSDSGCDEVAVPYSGAITLERSRDPETPDELFVPANLDEAIQELDVMLPPEFRQSLSCTGEKDLAAYYHHGFGTWIRNNWDLWAGGDLAKSFNELGIHQPDDMSGIILTSYLRHVKDIPIDLDEQIRYYRKYWELNHPPPPLVCPDGSEAHPEYILGGVVEVEQPAIFYARCSLDSPWHRYDPKRGWFPSDPE